MLACRTERSHRLSRGADRAAPEVAKQAAMLHVENLEEHMLSRMTSRSGATLHDEQDHLIQRRGVREALGDSPIILMWDEGSKRMKAWCVVTLVGSREQGDGSRSSMASGPAKGVGVDARVYRGVRASYTRGSCAVRVRVVCPLLEREVNVLLADLFVESIACSVVMSCTSAKGV